MVSESKPSGRVQFSFHWTTPVRILGVLLFVGMLAMVGLQQAQLQQQAQEIARLKSGLDVLLVPDSKNGVSGLVKMDSVNADSVVAQQVTITGKDGKPRILLTEDAILMYDGINKWPRIALSLAQDLSNDAHTAGDPTISLNDPTGKQILSLDVTTDRNGKLGSFSDVQSGNVHTQAVLLTQAKSASQAILDVDNSGDARIFLLDDNNKLRGTLLFSDRNILLEDTNNRIIWSAR